MENYRNYKKAAPTSGTGSNASGQMSDTDEEIQSLKTQIRGVKQDSVAATRHAVSKLAESEDIASTTLRQLENQSEKISSIDRQMEMADVRADVALEKSSELKRINNSMFSMFSIKNPFKSKTDPKKIDTLKAKHLDIKNQNEEARSASLENNHTDKDSLRPNPQQLTRAHSDTPNAGKNSQYNFEEDEEGMGLEKEIDGNLDTISDALTRLKGMSLAMNGEIETQNSQLDRINHHATSVQDKVARGNERLKKIT